MPLRVPIAERTLEKRTSRWGWRVSEYPEIFGDELSMDDYLSVSHMETKTSNKIKVSELMKFIQAHIDNKYD